MEETMNDVEKSERSRFIEELRWLATARAEYLSELFPDIAREVRTASHLADILERKTPVMEGGQGFGWMPSWRWQEWDEMAYPRTNEREVPRDDD